MTYLSLFIFLWGDIVSYEEYNDMFLKCQDTGKYHVFTFDIVGSKKMDDRTREIARQKLLKFITLFYNKLYRKGIEENKEILISKSNYGFLGDWSNDFGVKVEPFILGDVVGLTVNRDSITKGEMMHIYNECKKEVNIDFEFHLADGYYETNDYSLGDTQYFRGYCMDILSTLHKKEIIHDLNRLRKKINITTKK